MDWSNTFLVKYFFLLTIFIVMVVNSIFHMRQHKRLSIYIIVITTTALLLAVFDTLETQAKINLNIPLTTFMSFLGYVLNPFCIFFFIMMSGEIKTKKRIILILTPLVLNVIVYLLMFIPGAKEAVVYFTESEGDLHFNAGPLRFCSHVISGIYIAYLVYMSINNISKKDFGHGLTIISCALLVVIAVVIEAFFNDNDTIYVLSTTIAFSTVIYYLYLYVERSQIDALTGLYNRETYYRDVERLGKSIVGIVQFDMNGLKYINDNFGHLEGDKAIVTIANMIKCSAENNMYAYRIGGDEFILIAINATLPQLNDTIKKFKDKIAQTDYHCSIGYSIRESKQQSVTELFKEAERKMYEDKEAFYKSSASFERRKS